MFVFALALLAFVAAYWAGELFRDLGEDHDYVEVD